MYKCNKCGEDLTTFPDMNIGSVCGKCGKGRVVEIIYCRDCNTPKRLTEKDDIDYIEELKENPVFTCDNCKKSNKYEYWLNYSM